MDYKINIRYHIFQTKRVLAGMGSERGLLRMALDAGHFYCGWRTWNSYTG